MPHVAPETFFLTSYHCLLGTYTLISSQRGVVFLAPENQTPARLVRWERQGIRFQKGSEQNDTVAHQLGEYFAGRLRQFTVPLDLRGTPFQCQVWELLRCGIPYGKTRSYSQIAHALGRPTALRAVGGAIGSNPVDIVVPCHRVIGSDGKLTGYGGGLARKEALLNLEARVLRQGTA